MNYLEKPCTRCQSVTVNRPTKDELKKKRILVACDTCWKCSRYNTVAHVDGSSAYFLSKWGRGDGGDLVRVPRWIQRKYKNLSSLEIRLALDKVYGHAV